MLLLLLCDVARYFVTWKADGTRYMMLVTKWGCYLIDRSGGVRRVTMRFPTLLPPEKGKPEYPVGPPHMWTLLDGERGGWRMGAGSGGHVHCKMETAPCIKDV
jgi:mRNA-capping enzyme